MKIIFLLLFILLIGTACAETEALVPTAVFDQAATASYAFYAQEIPDADVLQPLESVDTTTQAWIFSPVDCKMKLDT